MLFFVLRRFAAGLVLVLVLIESCLLALLGGLGLFGLLRRHKACGCDFHPVQTCSACGEVVGARDVETRPGPYWDTVIGMP